MESFKFKNYKVDVEIEGHKFALDTSTKTGEIIREAANELLDMKNAIEKGEKTSMDAVELGYDVIDRILGDGASGKIFGNRERLVDDFVDLFMWIQKIVRKRVEAINKSVK